MERGVIALFETRNFTNETSIDSIFDYLEESVDKFCEITDMEIIESMSGASSRRAEVYVGRNGDSHPLFCFCNININNIVRIGVKLTNDVGSQPDDPTSTTNLIGNMYEYYGISSNYNIYMSYLKDGENIVFSLYSSPIKPGYTTNWKWIITKARYGEISVPFAMHVSANTIYASADFRIGFSIENPAFIAVNDMLSASSPVLPKTKEAILDQDIYIRGTDDVVVENIRLYSNKIGMQGGSIMKIGGVKYFVIGRNAESYPTLLLKLEEQT